MSTCGQQLIVNPNGRWYPYPGTTCRVPPAGYHLPGTTCRVPPAGYHLPGTTCQGTKCVSTARRGATYLGTRSHVELFGTICVFKLITSITTLQLTCCITKHTHRTLRPRGIHVHSMCLRLNSCTKNIHKYWLAKNTHYLANVAM
jgi:hypothetical protein